MTGNKTEPLKERALRAIETSGYPLEMRVLDAMTRGGFQTIPSWRWWNAEEEKERELDLVGTRYAVRKNIVIAVHFLAECKRKRLGAVLFDTGRQQFADTYPGMNTAWGRPRRLHRSGEPAGALLGIGSWARWDSLHWPPAGAIGYQFGWLSVAKGGELERRRRDGEELRDDLVVDQSDQDAALESILGGLRAFRASAQPGDGNSIHMDFVAPAIVIEGPIFAYRLATPEAPSGIEEVDHGTYYRRGIEHGHAVEHRVDFLREPAVPGLLDALGRSADEIADLAEANSLVIHAALAREKAAKSDPSEPPDKWRGI